MLAGAIVSVLVRVFFGSDWEVLGRWYAYRGVGTGAHVMHLRLFQEFIP